MIPRGGPTVRRRTCQSRPEHIPYSAETQTTPKAPLCRPVRRDWGRGCLPTEKPTQPARYWMRRSRDGGLRCRRGTVRSGNSGSTDSRWERCVAQCVARHGCPRVGKCPARCQTCRATPRPHSGLAHPAGLKHRMSSAPHGLTVHPARSAGGCPEWPAWVMPPIRAETRDKIGSA
jgi:hypothetical protein